MSKKVGMVSFRFEGNDGVTLETLKWVDVFTDLNYLCYYCSGESSMPSNNSMVFPEMHFNHNEIKDITKRCFMKTIRSHSLTAELHNMRRVIKKHLYSFINTLHIDLLVVQNVLAIPMNIPFSMALVEMIAETRIPTIIHHHDFYWERERFRVNCIPDILKGCFPPDLANVTHVVINTQAQKELSYRYGISSVVVPNVMNFETIPQGKDEYNSTLRKDLGIEEDALFLLQPTRIVQRKGIENTIEIARRLNEKSIVVISHESGDEGGEYKERVLEYAQMLNVPIKLVADFIGKTRGTTPDGKKIYDLNDVYSNADLITYPSIKEGFGNALLETFYYRRPIVVNIYPVYATDIKDKGVCAIEFTNFVSKSTITQIKELLNSTMDIEEMTETNYRISLKYFSYTLLRNKLRDILQDFFGV